jgi:hypothetical protein
VKRIVILILLALFACDAEPRPIRYCVDSAGVVLDDYQCSGALGGTRGLQWTYYHHYYTPGQTVVIRFGELRTSQLAHHEYNKMRRRAQAAEDQLARLRREIEAGVAS